MWPEQVEWALEGDGGPTRDERGEQLVHELADRLRREGKRFEDEYFPPSDESLYQFTAPTPEEVEDPTAELVRRDQSKFGYDKGGKPLEVVWERGTEIATRRGLPPSAAVIFSRDPHDPEKLSVDPDDIAQGALGDCWFLAAIASCAASESDRLIRDLIIEEGWDVGLIGVKFFVRGCWTTIIIDDFFPLAPLDPGANATDRALLFASSKQHTGQRVDEIEFWPMVLEKAFAKLHGSWEAIGANGGRPEDALHYLTGAPTVGLLDRRAEPEAAWQQLKDLIKDPDDEDENVGFVSATLRKDLDPDEARSSGLIYGHAYSVLACLEDVATAGQVLQDGRRAVGPSLTHSGELVRLVCVRNPWGEGEWRGAYNDADTVRWTDRLVELARAANADAEVLSRTQSGTVSGSDDGSFWMEWSDVTKYLSLGACNPFVLQAPAAETAAGLSGEWATQPGCALAKVQTYRGEWRAAEGTAGGCTAGLFQFNPRLRISSTSKDCQVYLTLSLPDLRFLVPDEDAHPELHKRYGLRYPSVCVLRRHGIAESVARTDKERRAVFRFEDVPTDQPSGQPGEGFYDPQGWCDERQVPLVLDGTQRQSSAKISLDAIKTGGSCVEVMIVNELRGAEGEFWLTLHCSSGELFVESLPAPAPTPQQAAAMARDVGRTDTDPTAVFKEEEEVGAELIAVLSQQQRELRAGASLIEPPTPIGVMAIHYEGGPEDDTVAMSFAPPGPWVTPAMSRALWYATGCVVAGTIVSCLPALAEKDPDAAAWAVATAAAARRHAHEAARVAVAATTAAAATIARCCSTNTEASLPAAKPASPTASAAAATTTQTVTATVAEAGQAQAPVATPAVSKPQEAVAVVAVTKVATTPEATAQSTASATVVDTVARPDAPATTLPVVSLQLKLQATSTPSTPVVVQADTASATAKQAANVAKVVVHVAEKIEPATVVAAADTSGGGGGGEGVRLPMVPGPEAASRAASQAPVAQSK